MSISDEEFAALVEQAVTAQAVYKVVADAVSTKNPDSVRSMMDLAILEKQEATGAKSFDAKVKGKSCGTISVRKNKAKEVAELVVDNQSDFDAWLLETGYGYTKVCCDDKLIIDICMRTGEVPEGAHVETHTTPDTFAGTTLKVDVDKVAAAYADQLPAAVSNLLKGEK